MTTDELREQIIGALTPLMIGGAEPAKVLADALVAGPLAPLVAQLRAVEDFAAWIVSLDDDDPNSPGRIDRRTVTLTQITERARRALGES